MDLHNHREGFTRLERSVLDSKAFRDLKKTPTAMLVLLDFLSFIQWDGKPKHKGERKTPPRMVNGNRLTYSFAEAERRGIPRGAFNRAITAIIEHGFLSITSHGTGLHLSPNVYAWSDAWKFWTGKPVGKRPKSETRRGFTVGNTTGNRF